MLNFSHISAKWWESLAPDLSHSVLLCDTAALELLHWSGILLSGGVGGGGVGGVDGGGVVGVGGGGTELGVVGVHLITDHVIDYGAGVPLVFLVGEYYVV